jgi:hypothetical protein
MNAPNPSTCVQTKPAKPSIPAVPDADKNQFKVLVPVEAGTADWWSVGQTVIASVFPAGCRG